MPGWLYNKTGPRQKVDKISHPKIPNNKKQNTKYQIQYPVLNIKDQNSKY